LLKGFGFEGFEGFEGLKGFRVSMFQGLKGFSVSEFQVFIVPIRKVFAGCC
jgi:hypothetical protein